MKNCRQPLIYGEPKGIENMMYYIESPSNDPCFNLALEQYVFDSLDRKHSYFMLWQNDNSIIVGKHQNTIAEINESYVRERSIKVVRRLSGGGAVYHDMGNINFTFIADKDSELFDFSQFCMPLIRALESVGVDARINGRNDMTIDGKKFSGNSQYAKEGRIMHHGTVMYDSNLQTVAEALNVSKDKIESKGLKSVKSRVTNVRPYVKNDMETKQFFGILKDFMFKENNLVPYQLTAKDYRAVGALRQERYSTWAWNYGFSPKYTIEKKRRIEGCGSIEVHMNVEAGKITDLAFSGDYFSNTDSQPLTKLLKGCRLCLPDLSERLQTVPVSRYFHNLENQKFLEILLQ